MFAVKVKLDLNIPTFTPFPGPPHLTSPSESNRTPFGYFGNGSDVWRLSLQFRIWFPGQVSLEAGLFRFGTSRQHVTPPAVCLLIPRPTYYCPKFPLPLPYNLWQGCQQSKDAEDGRPDTRFLKRYPTLRQSRSSWQVPQKLP